MSADPDERFNETCPPSVICAACFQSAHTQRPDQTGCQCACHRDSATRPEQAAAVTPGQAAYEAWNGGAPNAEHSRICWENDPGMRPRWEAAAQTAIKAAPHGSERVAELVTEGNELRARIAELERLLAAPAVATAGTEHLAEKIRGLVIGPDHA